MRGSERAYFFWIRLFLYGIFLKMILKWVIYLSQTQKRVDRLSTMSLKIDCYAYDNLLGSATGFIVSHKEEYYLITNWHVVSGKNSDTGKCIDDKGAVPTHLRIHYHAKGYFGIWIINTETLYDDEHRPRWIEHPRGHSIDLVALPIALSDKVTIYPFDMSLVDTDISPRPAMQVSIIGYPLGLSTAGLWAIWKTGHIASDPELDYDGRPAFLIDATTRNGMSGSPVILRSTGGYDTSDGRFILGSPVVDKFLGVYSGRIHKDSEIGRVWRPILIREILNRGNLT